MGNGVDADAATPRVAVIGAGVAGLTAAHELAVRGLEVTVFEEGDAEHIGGKARSFPIDVPLEMLDAEDGLLVDRQAPPLLGPADQTVSLPAEHGFRFFPGFYRHLIDSMGRTPGASTSGPSNAAGSVGPGGPGRARDHLVGLESAIIARVAGDHRGARTVEIPLPTEGRPPSPSAVARMVWQGVQIPDLKGLQWLRFGQDALGFFASLAGS